MPISLTDVGLFASVSLIFLYLLRKRKAKYHSNEYCNPEIQELERLPAHVTLASFNSEDDARNRVCQPTCSPFVKLLSGNWNFRLFAGVQEALSFVEEGVDKESCGQITVPGHWQLQVPGDAPIYT